LAWVRRAWGGVGEAFREGGDRFAVAFEGLAFVVRESSCSSIWSMPSLTAMSRPTTGSTGLLKGRDVLFCGMWSDVLIVPGADLRMVTHPAAAGSGDAGRPDLLRVTGGCAAGRQAAR
jgi:hypothetical protein